MHVPGLDIRPGELKAFSEPLLKAGAGDRSLQSPGNKGAQGEVESPTAAALNLGHLPGILDSWGSHGTWGGNTSAEPPTPPQQNRGQDNLLSWVNGGRRPLAAISL